MLPQEPHVKIKSYTPLTFMCMECGAVFDALDTSGEALNADIERHMAEQHFVRGSGGVTRRPYLKANSTVRLPGC